MMKQLVKANSWFLATGSLFLALLILVFVAFPAPSGNSKCAGPNACSINKSRSSANTTSFLVI